MCDTCERLLFHRCRRPRARGQRAAAAECGLRGWQRCTKGARLAIPVRGHCAHGVSRARVAREALPALPVGDGRRLRLQEAVQHLSINRDFHHLHNHLDLFAVPPSGRVRLVADVDLQV